MATKKTALIFGISSFLGSNLAELLKKDYRVVGTYYSTPVDIPEVLAIKCDVHDKDVVQKVVYLFKPDVTIYAVGLSDLSACQKFPKVADALNTAGVFNVSSASERYKSKFVYFSTSFIFSGEDALFKENDTPMPSSVYGNTVASSEFFIQKSCLNYLIFRCSPIMGRSYNPYDLTWLETIERLEY
ncbi:MAG: sugar nucleotide-binding protein, partial [Bacteriovoracaceae bacterium]